MLKSRLTATTLAAAMAFASTGAAWAETLQSGYVGGSLGYAQVDTGAGDDDAVVYGVEGAYAAAITDRFDFQADVSYDYVDADAGEVDTLTGQAHVFVRDSEKGAAGVFVAVADNDGSTVYGGGVEGDWYNGQWTVGGSIAYLDGEDDANITGGEAHVRYFLSDNLKLEGGVSYANVDAGAGDDNALGLRAEAEWQYADTPLSVYVAAGYTSFDDADIDATAVLVGVRWNFGTGDLMERDRSGASWTGAKNLLGVAG